MTRSNIFPLLPFLLFLILLGSNSTSAQFVGLDEFHEGYGGFSIRAGPPSKTQPMGFILGDYGISGTAFTWERGNYRIRITVFTAGKLSTKSMAPDNAAVIAKWKAALLKDIPAKAIVQEKPYIFSIFAGSQITTTGPYTSLTRLFAVNGTLVEETIIVQDARDIASAEGLLNSFRLLTKPERTLAMIEEFTPPPLAQQKPTTIPTSDQAEQGLLGNVRRIRDTFKRDLKSEDQVIQEIHFDTDGFRFVDISFNAGFPDIITTWGWENGKRINLQSAVNYPPGYGPIGGRTAMVSGSISSPGVIMTGPGRRYGNLIETKWDENGRPFERRRFTSSNSLVYAERYIYNGDKVEIRTVDDSGGFIGRVRHRLDRHNNILETETLFENGSVIETSKFEYEFDDRGNWIVKKVFRKASAGSRTTSQAAGTYRRNISYYEIQDKRQVG